jgi:hypothetical protein
MDQNVARTHTSLALLTALINQLKRNGTLSDQDLKDITKNAPKLVGTINASYNDLDGMRSTLERVREALD